MASPTPMGRCQLKGLESAWWQRLKPTCESTALNFDLHRPTPSRILCSPLPCVRHTMPLHRGFQAFGFQLNLFRPWNH